MNTLVRTLRVLSLISPAASRADARPARRNMLSINPGDLLNGTVSLEFELASSFPAAPSHTAIGHELGIGASF